jgi:hypothetical protein
MALLITTPQLAEALGIAPAALKNLREKLTPETDWIAGQPIQFTESGVKNICAAVGLDPTETAEFLSAHAGTPQPSPAASDGTPTVASDPPERGITLTVIRPARGNSRVVLCKNPAGTGFVNLLVKDNTNFIPGMAVPRCLQRPLSAQQFDYEGRLPRRKGRF